MYKEVFALRLYARRKELQLSQIDVSRETEINQSNISKLEAGKLEPNLETLGKLANFYEVSVDWLLGNPHNEKEGDVLKTAIEEFYDEALATVRGAEYEASNKEDLLDFIYYNLARDREKLLNKYNSIQDEE